MSNEILHYAGEILQTQHYFHGLAYRPRKRSFSKALFKQQAFENARFRLRLDRKHIFKTELLDNDVVWWSLKEFYSSTYQK